MKARQRPGVAGAIWRALSDNVGLKLFSVLAAILLFSLVHGWEDAQRTVVVDVVALLPPASAQKVLLTTLPDEVRVTMRGQRTLVQALGRQSLPPVQIDLRDPTKRYFTFDPSELDLPAGVRVTEIVPATIPLEWANRAQRRVPISVPIVGHASDGLQVRSPVRVEPAFVEVIGPAGEVDDLTEVRTQPVDVTAFGVGTQELRQPLEPAPQHAHYVIDAPVRVVVEVVPAVATRTLRHVLVSVVGGAERAELRPSRVDLELRGVPATLDALDEDAVLPMVDLSGGITGPNGVLRDVTVTGLPPGVEVVRVAPGQVLVTNAQR